MPGNGAPQFTGQDGKLLPELASAISDFLDDYFGKAISSQAVFNLHKKADTDLRKESAHHTLGAGANQGSPGDHIHDGGTSNGLITKTFTGNTTSPTTLATLGAIVHQITQALVAIGATDSTV